MDMNNHAPTLKNDGEDCFRRLVLEGLTLAAIRQEMSPDLDEFDDIPLIKKMLQIIEGENGELE